MDPISAAIAIGGQLLGGVASSIGASGSNKRAIRASKDMQRTAIQHQTNMFNANKEFVREMFNAQNAYNAPSAQMQRLRSAGINPWSIAGGQPTSATTPSGVGGSAGATASAPNLQNELAGIGSSIQALSPLLAEMRLKEATTANVEAETYKKQLEAKGQKILNTISEAEGNIKLLESQRYPEWLEYKMRKDRAQGQLLGAQTLGVDITNEFLGKKLESEIGLNEKQALKIEMEVNQMPEYLDIAKQDANTRKFQAETDRMEADLKKQLLPFQQAHLRSLSDNIDQGTKNLLLDAGIKVHNQSSALYGALAARLKYENALNYGVKREKAMADFAEETTRLLKKYGDTEKNLDTWQKRVNIFQGVTLGVKNLTSSLNDINKIKK